MCLQESNRKVGKDWRQGYVFRSVCFLFGGRVILCWGRCIVVFLQCWDDQFYFGVLFDLVVQVNFDVVLVSKLVDYIKAQFGIRDIDCIFSFEKLMEKFILIFFRDIYVIIMNNYYSFVVFFVYFED